LGIYSIKDLERLSGIKAHTIRIWEQRYNITEPDRTDTNIRLYSDSDLRRILNVALLNKNGYKISSISKMSTAEIQQEVLNLTDKDSDFTNQINALTIAMVETDEDRFEKIISTNTLRLGFEKTMIRIIYPFLQRIGLMWQTGAINPAQEHFISNLIRQKLIVAIDGQQNLPAHITKTFLLFCPEGEMHEIPLLFTSYILRSRKFRVIYLGISVPLPDLQTIAAIQKPDFLFTTLTTRPQGIDTQEYLNQLSEAFKKIKILVTGQEILNINYKLPNNILALNNIDETVSFLEQIVSKKSSVS